MDIENIVALLVNNGVAVGIIVYFMYRDNKFMNNLTSALTSLQDSIESIKKLLEKDSKKDKKENEDE